MSKCRLISPCCSRQAAQYPLQRPGSTCPACGCVRGGAGSAWAETRPAQVVSHARVGSVVNHCVSHDWGGNGGCVVGAERRHTGCIAPLRTAHCWEAKTQRRGGIMRSATSITSACHQGKCPSIYPMAYRGLQVGTVGPGNKHCLHTHDRPSEPPCVDDPRPHKHACKHKHACTREPQNPHNTQAPTARPLPPPPPPEAPRGPCTTPISCSSAVGILPSPPPTKPIAAISRGEPGVVGTTL